MQDDSDPPSSSSPSSKSHFIADYDKRGQASCKRCKQKITKGSFRIGKLAPNPFSESGGEMKQWFHPNCLFEALSHARASSAKLTKLEDVSGVQQLNDADRDALVKFIEGLSSKGQAGSSKGPGKGASPSKMTQYFPSSPSPKKQSGNATASAPSAKYSDHNCPDYLFSSFCTLCDRIAQEASYKSKSTIVHDFLFRLGATRKHGYCGDPHVMLKFLLPGEKGLERVYNVNNKQLTKLFADIFGADAEAINNDINEHGDISVVIADKYFVKSTLVKPVDKCQLTLADVDALLDSMTQLTKYDEQLATLRKFTQLCGVSELRYLIRLLKKDLRMNARGRHILDAVSDTAYDAFQHSRDLDAICRHITATKSPDGSPKMKNDLSVKVNLMTPVQPMLAEACKSIDYALQKCPKGMFAEIKYDGERVQVHHSGNEFSYYSRSLKPVLPHKVSYLSNAIPKAFPSATDLILDGEIVLVDTTTHLPLPFGTLGVHKKAAFTNAQVCLFVFDMLRLNGKSLMDKPIMERREALRNVMNEIPDRVVLSEVHKVSKPAELKDLLDYVFTNGLEGLVLKPVDSLYEPGKRHWLKMKKDYLADGAMADTADLIVLGSYFGTGNKGGLMSVFLLGVYDPLQKKFLTVTKCGNGHDDATIARLQKELDMVRINKDPTKVPSWLVVKNGLVPDFVARDPKRSPVWEVTGAEFSKSDIHTADGISIRFPRITKIRDDKNWESATSLEELRVLFKNSRQQAPKLSKGEEEEQEEPASKHPEKGTSDLSSPKKEKKVKRKLVLESSEDESGSTVSYHADDDGDKAGPSKPAAKTKITTDVKAQPVPSSPKKQKSLSGASSSPNKEKQLDWSPADIFSGCHFYFEKTSIDGKTRDSMFRCVIAYGAASVCSLPTDSRITHCIVSEKCVNVPPSIPSNCKVLQAGWLNACVKSKSLSDTASFIIH